MAVAVPVQYQPLVAAAAKGTGLPAAVVAAQANVESGFDAKATSPTGAQGWLQFEPSTWAAQKVPGSPYDPAAATQGYIKLMGSLLNQFKGNVRDALAAYNAGPGNLAAGYGYADRILSDAGAGTGTALPSVPAGATTSVPVTSFNQAGFNAAQAKYIAGTAVQQAGGTGNPFNASPGTSKGFAGSFGSSNPLLAKGLLTTTAPSKADFVTTAMQQVATTHLGQLATEGGTTLTGIKTSPGPVANTVVPDASWNPAAKPIASWIVPVLEWASAHGWKGSVTSGYRSLQQQQAINASGAFSAPAGQSNHETANYPGGAVDVSDPSQLMQVLKGYGGSKKLVGGVLGPVDPEHFSANGH